MNKRKIIQDCAGIETTGCITFEKLIQKYNKKLEELQTKYENVHDVVVTCNSYEYNDGEDYIAELEIRFKRNETDAECKRRLEWQEFCIKENEEREKDRLKELVEKYPDLTKVLLTTSK